MIKKHQRFFNLILVVLDGVSLCLAYLCAYLLKWDDASVSQMDRIYFEVPLWMIPLLVVCYFFMEVYSPMRSRMFHKEMLLIIKAHLVGIIGVYSSLYLTRTYNFSREVLITFGLLGLLFMIVERFIVRRTLRYLRKMGYNQKHLLIIGAGKTGIDFAKSVRKHRDYGYSIVGFLDDDVSKHGTKIYWRPVLGGRELLPELIDMNRVDDVIVALPLAAYDKYRDIVEACEKGGVRIRIIPDYYGVLPRISKVEDFDGIPLLNIRHVPLDDPLNYFLKQWSDIVVSLLAIIFTAPLMFVIAVGIKLTSKGPVFFRQERIGLGNKPFMMLKFRSMRVADEVTASTVWTTENDPRKTPFGTFLRRTSLDELPQFLNVLRGDMSVVGPRPERPFFVRKFKGDIPKYMVKHQVKPGITGWAQVNGWRGDTSISKRIECDIYYIENWDLIFDVKIILMTIFKGLLNRHAY